MFRKGSSVHIQIFPREKGVFDGRISHGNGRKEKSEDPVEMNSRFFHCVWEGALDNQGCRTPAFFKGFSAPGNQLDFTLMGSPVLLT